MFEKSGLALRSQADIFRQIEQRYGFSVPTEYRLMSERGWFDFDDARNRVGPDYLWLYDMEWLDPAGIRDHEFPEYCEPGFVPFAFTGGGDHWCWWPAESVGGVAPVVFCPRDSIMAEFYAPDFLGGLYRHVLDYAAFGFDDADEDRQHLREWNDRLGPLFPPTWRTTLAELLTAPFRKWKTGPAQTFDVIGLLSPDEHRAILHRDLGFARLDEEFKWMLDVGD
jgi:hypothetical protein